jgi:hypothetical protein
MVKANARKPRPAVDDATRPYLGLAHYIEHGVPNYPLPRAENVPDESSQTVPFDAFSFSNIT